MLNPAPLGVGACVALTLPAAADLAQYAPGLALAGHACAAERA